MSDSIASIVKLPEKKLLVDEVSLFTKNQSLKDPAETTVPSATAKSYEEMLSESSHSTVTEPKSRWFEKINKKFKKKSSSKQKVKATAF